MDYKTRKYPLFSAVHPPCGVLSCCHRKEIESCYLCEEYPCKKYDDGRRKSFYCVAVNLLDLQDVKSVMGQVFNEIMPETPNCLIRCCKNRNCL